MVLGCPTEHHSISVLCIHIYIYIFTYIPSNLVYLPTHFPYKHQPYSWNNPKRRGVLLLANGVSNPTVGGFLGFSDLRSCPISCGH